jgi:hypothetical protein
VCMGGADCDESAKQGGGQILKRFVYWARIFEL